MTVAMNHIAGADLLRLFGNVVEQIEDLPLVRRGNHCSGKIGHMSQPVDEGRKILGGDVEWHHQIPPEFTVIDKGGID